MKRTIYTLLLFGFALFFGCEKSDFSPEPEREFAMLTVRVTDAASHTAQQCGGPDVLQNIKVSLYLSSEDRKNGIGAVASKLTQSRGGATFTKLKGNTYYIAVRGESVSSDRTVTLKKGEVKSMPIAVVVDEEG